MSETWTLFGMLALFYVAEGIWWSPRAAACVFATFAGRVGLRRTVPLREDADSGMLLPPTVLCSGRRFVATAWPLSIAPEGISSRPFPFADPFHAAGREARFLPFADAGELRVRGGHLVKDGEVLARTDSPRDAQRLHALILGLARLPAADRAERIREALDRSFDVRMARRRIRKLRWLLRPTTGLPALQLATLLVIAPAYSLYFGLVRVWPILVVLQVALAAAGLMAFLRISRALPTLPAEDRLFHSVMILLFPPVTPRYPEIVSRGLVSDLHPIAVAAALGHGSVPLDVCRRFMKSLDACVEAPSDPAAGPRGGIERWFASEQRSAAGRALARAGIRAESLVTAPPREAAALSYCPACLAQYRDASMGCADCPGVRLEPFGATAGELEGPQVL